MSTARKNFLLLSFHFSPQEGFTLVELLTVVVILGVLATATLAAINPVGQLAKSNDAHRKSDLEAISRALELYYQDNGAYPASNGNQIFAHGITLSWGSSWQPYISTLPKDPKAVDNYVYYSPNSQTFYLYATLERGKDDQQACNSLGTACGSLSGAGFPSATACGGTCNYGVSSSNTSP